MTDTVNNSPRLELNRAQPGRFDRTLAEMKFGDMLSPIKITVASLGATATPDITSAAVRAAATVIVGRTPAMKASEMFPPIGQIVNLRVTASGTAASVGTYGITDDAGTAIIPPGGASAAMGIAKLSDDGKTITFPNTVTGFVLTYYPRAAVAMDSGSEVPPAPGT